MGAGRAASGRRAVQRDGGLVGTMTPLFDLKTEAPRVPQRIPTPTGPLQREVV